MGRLKMQSMLKVIAMTKPFISIFFATILFASASCQASEANSSGDQIDVEAESSPTSTYNPRQVHETSLSRKNSNKYYCDSHLLETELILRRDTSSENRFFNVDIEAKLDGKSLNFGQYIAKINNSSFPTDVALQYHCINSQITIFIYLDQGNGNVFGTRVGEIYIDVDTGEVMPEPRRSPKK